MHIAVIGANGKSGKAFVTHALEAGHSIRAGVRRDHSLAPHPKLTIVACDATVLSDVENLIGAQDAVVSLIGHVKGSPSNVQTTAIRTLCSAMSARGVKRVVSLTGTGVRFPGDRISIVDRILNKAISLIDPARIQDGKDHVAFLKHTSLEWTIIRVLKLQNTRPRAFALRIHGPTKWIVSRQEVAQAALQILSNHSFVREAPIISPKLPLK